MAKIDKEQKRTWGGRRPGSGRKSIGSKQFPVTLSGELAKLVEGQENRSRFIKDCIEKALQMDVVGGLDGEVMEPIELPFFDVNVAAGPPAEVGDAGFGEKLDLADLLCPNKHPYVMCYVNGESMIGARMFTGDIAVVDVSPRIPSAREVALCEVNGGYTFKYVRQTKDGFTLVPANPDFKEFEVRPGDDFHIRGIVKSVIRKM